MTIRVGKTPKERVYKCDHKGCATHKVSNMPQAIAMQTLVTEEGWYVDPATSAMYCPNHIPKFEGPQVLRVLKQH